MEHLIADSGIHFIKREVEFNPSEPFIMNNGRALKYSFCETIDFLEGYKVFNLLYYNSKAGHYIPIDELLNVESSILRKSNGREELDPSGMVIMDDCCSTALFTAYEEDSEEVYHINSLQSFRVPDPNNAFTQVPAFNLILDKWLPMPMFKKEVDGVSNNYPLAWCRMKMMKIGEGAKKGTQKFLIVWAFDTQMADDELSNLRPYISDFDGDSAEFSLCNKVDLLLDFMSSKEEFHAFSEYIASLLGIDLTRNDSNKYKAFYIYFINLIRLLDAAPEITLHNKKDHDIFVDLVLDVGNSRTCGILFEEGKFSEAKMLELIDLTNPWEYYENKTYDMRVVFRKADFGNDIVLDEEVFQWKSFVRIGEEARKLVYHSLEEEGLSEKATNHSSPKRYLWDKNSFEGQWENLVTTDDPYNVFLSKEISVPVISRLFNDLGEYTPEKADESDFLDFSNSQHHYSRSSLMTFAYIEIFQHALAQINSIRYRQIRGNVDCRRYIRNVIITCPTAMPISEQIFLRQSASDAYDAIMKCMPMLKKAEIIPNPTSIKITDPFADINNRVWTYDEASCCQLTYLCAEIADRYKGEVHKFFQLKGHKEPNSIDGSSEKKILTIGTIDIGAGTTDLMICSYEYEGQTFGKLTPNPLFWDSFYLAGDDILRNLVQNIVIEGNELGSPNIGNISSALVSRILSMSETELKSLPCLDNIVYRSKINDICMTINEEEKKNKLVAFASNLVHDFFGIDSSMMGYRERRCRTDFNTQISVPIAQRMLELLRTHRPSKLYSYEELFSDLKPADYLLNYFEHHFGFRFEELNWRYDPNEISEIVKSTMENLMKQLALVLHSYACDIVLLAGRPTSLDAITELFIKYVPIAPHRLIRLNDYRVGNWFPTADGQGYFYDQKAIVAVGAMVGYQASHAGLDGMVIDFSKMIRKMSSTANYLGIYNSRRQQVSSSILTPSSTSASIRLSVFPAFIGCKQLDSAIYQARPLYAIYNKGNTTSLDIRLSRSYNDNKELLVLEEVTDSEYRNRKKEVIMVQQSLVDDGKYWLDKGEFELTIK